MFDNLTQSLRDNPRLRWGVALIVGLFWLYGILLLQEDLDERNRQRIAVAQTNARMQAQAAQPEWTTRHIPAKTLTVQLESQLWRAPTPGLAQAAFQDWLNTTLQQAGVAKLQVTVTVMQDGPGPSPRADSEPMGQPGPAATPEDLWKIRAKINFEAPHPMLLAALSRIETHEKKIVVSALNIRTEQPPVPRVELELLGYFQKQLPPTPGPGAIPPAPGAPRPATP